MTDPYFPLLIGKAAYHKFSLEYQKDDDHSAALFRAHDEREAQRLLDGGLAAAGLSAKELDSLPGSDVRKVALANLLLERTLARQRWIAVKFSDAQRSKRQSTSSPIPYQETEIDRRLKEFLQSVRIC